MFTTLFGLRFAVPMLTLTQLSSNGSRLWLNRREVRSDRVFVRLVEAGPVVAGLLFLAGF